MFSSRKCPTVVVCVLVTIQLLAATAHAQKPRTERVLIETPKPYTRVVAGIRALGGKVTNEFKYADAISAEVPSDAIGSLRTLVGPDRIQKDGDVPKPGSIAPVRRADAASLSIQRNLRNNRRNNRAPPTVAPDSAQSGTYLLNLAGTDLALLHSKGFTGDGVIVAVLDTGLRPGYASLDKSVIAGVDFVGDGLGYSNRLNDPHGTFVASIITADATVRLPAGIVRRAVNLYAPEAVANESSIRLTGSAPKAKIFVVRLFSPNPAVTTTESQIIAAIEYIADLKERYDKRRPGGLNIQVANMSFGNTTLWAGRDLLDRSVDVLLKAGIVPVLSAGNSGPSSLTISSPGSSFSALTIGAASASLNERIFREIDENNFPDTYFEGIGGYFRPLEDTQVWMSSSRGPNADGRNDPDVVANGFSVFGLGYDGKNEVSIQGGSSFSTPIVAGIAAVLRQKFPNAKAGQIRNAIIYSADPNVIAAGATELDQGRGMVNARFASTLLTGGIPGSLPDFPRPRPNVAVNIARSTTLEVVGGTVERQIIGLRPAERFEINYLVLARTKRVVVDLRHVNPALPPEQQNQLFGDDLYVAIHSAKTSAIGGNGDYVANGFTLGGHFVVEDPEPGILRITINGNPTNAGATSASVRVSSIKEPSRGISTEGYIGEGQQIVFPITVPENTSRTDIRLLFDNDWGHYPTSDIDLTIVDPAGVSHSEAATLAAPETTSFLNPEPGTWYAVIDGFDVPGVFDHFELRVTLDGKVVK